MHLLGYLSIPTTLFCISTAAAVSLQYPLRTHTNLAEPSRKYRPLHGRFLHITDFHPDRFYQIYASTSKDAACHRGQGPAGVYGAEVSDCDSPISLVNKTFEWVEKNFKDDIDFVVWTGDSARHDNDDDIPRSAEQVIGLNEFMVQKMSEVFGKHHGDGEDDDPNNDYVIPIVPNLGNNDILPHNVMDHGPNTWTRTYARVWRQFIPEAQKHQFEQGGWFYVEVIPNRLAVFSLNTLYFFVSNAAVDGCAAHSEPGYRQMEWLRIQLQFMRERGMKAILTGHVPPVRQDAKTSWDETCWQKYTLWLKQYRDVVITGLYGHFNYDHFMLQDFRDIDKDTKHGQMQYFHTDRTPEDDEDDMHTAVSSNYFIQLRNQWAKLPQTPKALDWPKTKSSGGSDAGSASKRSRERQRQFFRKMGGEYAERFASTFVSSSVVPNLYPTFRVYEYNITGLESHHDTANDILPPMYINHPSTEDVDLQTRKKGKKKRKFKVPDPPSKSSPPGPAYSPQTLTLLKYTQYLANLTHINNDFTAISDSDNDEVDVLKWNEGKHKGKKPHDKDHTPKPRNFKFEMQYETQSDGVYDLPDLTMPNLVQLAQRIGHFIPDDTRDLAGEADTHTHTQLLARIEEAEMEPTKKRKKHKKKKKKHHRKGGKHSNDNEPWYTFVRRAFVETMDPEELEDEFGR